MAIAPPNPVPAHVVVVVVYVDRQMMSRPVVASGS